MMRDGYAGRILSVDLTERTIREESPPEKSYRDFIGGTGLGVRILYEHLKPKTDPLGPDNILGFVTGPLTGTPVPGSGRLVSRKPCYALRITKIPPIHSKFQYIPSNYHHH